MPNATDFNAISIALASSEHVKQWSHGEVTKPETINYRTLRPEKDGLFCERIFGPTKDWECHCGKYKKQRFRGVICDRCGVEVTRANVRRQRMGHVTLAAPVAHIWFAKGIPSRLGLMLDMSPRNLERVLYFAQYVVTKVDPLLRKRKIEELENDHVERALSLEEQLGERVAALEADLARVPEDDAAKRDELQAQAQAIKGALVEQRAALQEALDKEKADVESIKPLMLMTESRHRELSDKYGDVFQAGIGAEAIMELLRSIDIDEEIVRLKGEVRSTSGQKRKKAGKRMEALEAFQRSGNKPEWMVMTALPVLPPDLRPMVQLDGGRFATSDLNDLYRRVINRNNRLKRLLELGAPEIIIRNEKRMLQEAVDDLIDNGRRGRPIVGSHNHQLKSLSDLLRGKQGRFRQNLLGKRVDYGGRSVIVVGPDLKLHECGLPKKMALELFKPFVMHRIWAQGMANNAKSAKRMVERAGPEVWDILEEVIQDRPVLLNRAPTLHRLGIQAFIPRLIEGSAIQLHPLVCAAFNADFDGDQMAVHVPLSQEAVNEARNVMLSKYNMLSPSSGEPLVAPTYEIVLGCYYLTQTRPGAKGEGRRYRDFDDVMVAFDAGALDLHARVAVRDAASGDWIETTPGRIVFNSVLPEETRRYDQVMDKKALRNLVVEIHRLVGNDATADALDNLKALGFEYATRSGITIGITDIKVPPEKAGIIAEAEEIVRSLESDYEMGLLSEQERHARIIGAWQDANGKMDKAVQERLSEFGGIYDMAHSGARGNEAQIKQMAAWRGLMSKPGKSGSDVIEQPVKSSFREGLSVLEYFISTHGARKGLTDTALRTADSGYLTRRLIDVAQEAIITAEDCGTERGVTIYANASPDEDVMIARLGERLAGRVAAAPVYGPRPIRVPVGRPDKLRFTASLGLPLTGVETRILTVDGREAMCLLPLPSTGAIEASSHQAEATDANSLPTPGLGTALGSHRFGFTSDGELLIALMRDQEKPSTETEKTFTVAAEFPLGGRHSDPDSESGEKDNAPEFRRLITKERLPVGKIIIQIDDKKHELPVDSLVGRTAGALNEKANKENSIRIAGLADYRFGLTSDGELLIAPMRKDEDVSVGEDEKTLRLSAAPLFVLRAIGLLPDDERVRVEVDDKEHALLVKDLREKVATTEGKPADDANSIALDDYRFGLTSDGELLVAPVRKDGESRLRVVGEVLYADAGAMIEKADAQRIQDAGVEEVYVRSPLTCDAAHGVCKQCYGWSPATGQLARVGDAVGIIAAQSIGEPGTQLTMRTFHMGGIAGLDITTGLPRVEEIFEARVPKGKARVAEIDGDVLVFENGQLVGEYEAPPDAPQITAPPVSFAPVARVVNRIPFTDSYEIGEGLKLAVKDGQAIKAGQPVAEPAPKPKRSRAKKAEEPAEGESAVPAERTATTTILARVSGAVRVADGRVEIDAYDTELRDHQVDATAQRLVRTGDKVEAGQRLTGGVKDPHDVLRILGTEPTLRYFTEQVQTVYRNQGVDINDKHIETIVGRMLRWVKVETIGDTEFLPNQTVDRDTFQSVNERVMAEGGEPATGKPDIRGVTRASLNTESFLAKASFQETARVLTEAAMSGDVDHLRGLKENVIIGRLIPARLDLTEEGRNLLGITDKIASRASLDDFDALMGLMSNEPGSPFDDDDDDDDFLAPRRLPSTIDFSLDDDDDDDDLLLDDEEDDDPLGEPEDSVNEETASPDSDDEEEEESEDASAEPDPDDLDPFEDSIAVAPDAEEEE